MKTTKIISALTICSISLYSYSAYSSVSTEEAKQLGTTLTPWGAEIAGNKDGTIPAYDGKGIKTVPNDPVSDPGSTKDPFADEKPLFSITAQNYQKYADKLDAQAEMFKKYPNYRMDIYPSHRTFVYPKYVLDNSIKNATSCKGIQDDLKLDGCYAGFPFPIPKTGRQVMWNKLMNFQAQSWAGPTHCWVINPSGSQVLQTYSHAEQEAPVFFPQNINKPLTGDTVYWRIVQDNLGPARKVGEKILILDYIDQVDHGRRAWQYIPGQRRVKLAPDLSYDTPSPNSSGASTMDDAKGFLGAMDRFDWKLVGKKEKYIMYNTFKMSDHSQACGADEKVNTAYFPNPDCVRWELHRVWVLEAKLKSGFRHIYARRMFFLDEDAPGADSFENYDASGKLYRIGFQQAYPFSNEYGGGDYDNTFITDLQTGISATQGSVGFKGSGWVVSKPWADSKFSPDAIAGEGIR